MTNLLHQLLSDAARRDPGHEAVRCASVSLTYGELDAAANGVAGALVAGGVRRGDRVAVYLPKRVEMPAAVYGVLKAGAAYVPLDPLAPVRRSAVVAADCAVRAVVTTPDRAAALLGALEGHRPELVILVDDGTAGADLPCPGRTYAEVTADPGAPDPGVPAIEMDLAYILYTSGSTGVPKGVMLTHRNALTFVDWCAMRIGVGPQDVLSNHAPLHFDLSVFDLYLAALGGATLVLVPESEAYFGTSLRDVIRREGITVWYSVPSALMLLTKAASAGDLAGLRAVVFAGEVYPTKQLRELTALVPHAALWNIYGPTETNVVTYHRVGELPAGDRPIPIGRACENTDVFAVTEDGREAGVGEEGELYVRGPTVMKGYWGRPDRTAEVLVPNPLSPDLPDLAYRTGDIVKLREDGEYDFLGRRDHQIKSRGYRVELGEVEAALNAHPGVDHAAAVAVPHQEWGTAIVAFVVAKEDVTIGERDVRGHVAKLLPRYMVPWRVTALGSLPRTSTGKIDRRALERAAVDPPAASGSAAPGAAEEVSRAGR